MKPGGQLLYSNGNYLCLEHKLEHNKENKHRTPQDLPAGSMRDGVKCEVCQARWSGDKERWEPRTGLTAMKEMTS